MTTIIILALVSIFFAALLGASIMIGAFIDSVMRDDSDEHENVEEARG